RGQGLPFARASWLERIHRNDGKPIHQASPSPAPAVVAPVMPQVRAPASSIVALRPASAKAAPVTPTPAAPVQPASDVAPAAQPAAAMATPPRRPEAMAPSPEPPSSAKPEPKAPPPAKKAGRTSVPPLVEPTADATALAKLVAAAKGYRPLYNFLEAQIRKTIPGVVIAARDRYIAIGAPREFAAVTLHPTEVRLGLDLGDRPFDALLQQAKLRGPGPAISHMVVLTDARQVGSELLGLAKTASDRVNAKL
ncbi:MAG TPA: DUF5655 domain-containing protein, partial [Hyphomicrobiaceae bacterium]|nr:DUF5655 domain-containing protein [Hyphomicrobiaceae bacterium]